MYSHKTAKNRLVDFLTDRLCTTISGITLEQATYLCGILSPPTSQLDTPKKTSKYWASRSTIAKEAFQEITANYTYDEMRVVTEFVRRHELRPLIRWNQGDPQPDCFQDGQISSRLWQEIHHSLLDLKSARRQTTGLFDVTVGPDAGFSLTRTAVFIQALRDQDSETLDHSLLHTYVIGIANRSADIFDGHFHRVLFSEERRRWDNWHTSYFPTENHLTAWYADSRAPAWIPQPILENDDTLVNFRDNYIEIPISRGKQERELRMNRRRALQKIKRRALRMNK